MIAHVAGAPLEELLAPLLAGGGAATLAAANMWWRRAMRRTPRTRSSHEVASR